MDYPRDLVGYGQHPPHADWPNGARVAVQFVLNYEEGGERSVLHGDAHAEIFLSDIIGAQPVKGRHISMESLYDYGARAGFWRLHRLFTERKLPVTVFAVAMALERNPVAAKAMVEAGWEVASHGYRWFDYQDVPVEVERDHMNRAIEIITRMTGTAPVGWYTGRTSPNTRGLVIENGSFLYDADAYDDDLPHWDVTDKGKVLVVPYTLDTNDMRFATAQGFNAGDQFFNYLRDAFDVLYAEGATSPKMMSVGLHCRLIGRPARIASLQRFLDHVAKHDKVWVATRADIARHWATKHPAP
ncbi:allantoinase PuuE [Roseiterribacter gracilis]|uniref:Chitooligosaccharide deacetylase n=1 Tax=Roseiterribacter gracilis TaxID=2812848 RepID=A0A8S8XDF8_9PROT|nr:chitin deacetylase [Rhodospirillales bacterium TMPK1]